MPLVQNSSLPLYRQKAVQSSAPAPPEPRQPVKPDCGYASLAKKAKLAEDAFNSVLNKLGLDRTTLDEVLNYPDEFLKGSPVIVPGPLKAERRSREKVETDYGGDWSRLLDILRASVAADSEDELRKLVETLKKNETLARPPKDRIAEPLPNGYRDILANVVLPNGVIAEIQFHTKPMLLAREVEHGNYEQARRQLARSKKNGKAISEEDQQKLDQLLRESKEIYAEAWKPSQKLKGAGAKAFPLSPLRKSSPAERGEEVFESLLIRTKTLKHVQKPKYGCVMMVLPDSLRKEITDWCLENVPEFHLGKGGRETKPHVTVKFGFTDSSPETVEKLKGLFSQHGPVKARLLGFEQFKTGYGKWDDSDGDVLHIKVWSPQLQELNRAVSEQFPCHDTYPDYKPHVTVAYLDPAVSSLYEGKTAPFLNQDILLDKVEWSGADGDREEWAVGILPNLGAKSLDKQGGEEPNIEDNKLKQADFVTLPEGVPGTNCGNCKFSKDGVCQHKELKGQKVTDRNCCSYWDASGTYRAWKSLWVKSLSRAEGPSISEIKKAGDRLIKEVMPGYGQIYLQEGTGNVWYVGGDGDERGFDDTVIELLGSIPGVEEVTYESEGFPHEEDGWVQVYPKQKATRKSLVARYKVFPLPAAGVMNGYTGKKKDAEGRTICYIRGRHVSCSKLEGKKQGDADKAKEDKKGDGKGRKQSGGGGKAKLPKVKIGGNDLKENDKGQPACLYAHSPEEDANQDGVADFARVGVPAFEVPPPPEMIPCLPNTTELEKGIEERFASQYLADPEGTVKRYFAAAQKVQSSQKVFSTYTARLLSPDYSPRDSSGEKVRAARCAYGTITLQAANAIAKKAFITHLDRMQNVSEDKKTMVCVCGPVNGRSKDLVRKVQAKAAAVWEAAGELNNIECPWLLEESRRRGFDTIFVYAHTDPYATWKELAAKAWEVGRLTDTLLFSESYVIGTQNFRKFMKLNTDSPDVEFVLVDGTTAAFKRLKEIPNKDYDIKKLRGWCSGILKKSSKSVQPSVLKGGLIGERIWPDA